MGQSGTPLALRAGSRKGFSVQIRVAAFYIEGFFLVFGIWLLFWHIIDYGRASFRRAIILPKVKFWYKIAHLPMIE